MFCLRCFACIANNAMAWYPIIYTIPAQQCNGSAMQRLNNATAQQCNGSAMQRLNNATAPQCDGSAMRRLRNATA